MEPFRDMGHVAQLKLYEGAKHALLLDTPDIRSSVTKDCLDFIDSVVNSSSTDKVDGTVQCL